jgi:chromosome segregation ATPase
MIHNVYALPTAPETPKPDDFAAAMRVLTVLADPAASKKMLAKLSEASAEAREQIAEAETRLAELDRRQSQLDARFATADEDITRLRGAAEMHVTNARAAFDADIAGRLRDLAARERQVADADSRYLQLNAELERKLAAVKAAVG